MTIPLLHTREDEKKLKYIYGSFLKKASLEVPHELNRFYLENQLSEARLKRGSPSMTMNHSFSIFTPSNGGLRDEICSIVALMLHLFKVM